MSTALPPSDGDRPTEGESAATPATSKAARPASRASGGTGAARSSSRARTAKSTDESEPTTAKGAAAKGATAKGTAASSAGTKGAAASGSAASGSAASGAAAAKKPATRTRRTTAKPAPIAPEGEAPSIMDATLGARNPVATGATAGSGAADTSSSPAEPLAASEATTKRLPTAEEVYAAPASSAPAARPADTTPETTVETTDVPEPESTTGERSATAATPIAVAPTAPEGATAPTERLGSTDAATERLGAIDADAAPSHADAASAAPATADAAAADSTTADSTTVPGAVPAAGGYARAELPAGALPADAAGPHAPSGRTVSDLADRLDDSRFFSSLFDFTFTNYVTRKLAGPVYVVGLVLIALGVVVGFANSLTSAIATHAPIGAFVFLFGVLITLVGAMLAVLLLRVGIEVFCAIIEIAQNTRRRRPPGE